MDTKEEDIKSRVGYLLLVSSSFVFISHLTNFLSYSVFMYVACFFLSHFAFEKKPARFEK